jgi:hypothetical protein
MAEADSAMLEQELKVLWIGYGTEAPDTTGKNDWMACSSKST